MENIKLKRKINYLEKMIQDKDYLYRKEHSSKEIIMQSEHSINQTNREEKEKNTRKKDHKQSETTLITGDSMLKNINQRGLVKKNNTIVKSVQSALSDLLTTSATHGTFSRPSTKRGLILIGLELNTNAKESF